MNHTFIFQRLLFLGFVFTSGIAVSAPRKITLKSGDQITVSKGDEATVVTCEAKGGDSVVEGKCDNFHSTSTCRNLGVGSPCKNSEGKKGTCLSSGTFGGVLNCECE